MVLAWATVTVALNTVLLVATFFTLTLYCMTQAATLHFNVTLLLVTVAFFFGFVSFGSAGLVAQTVPVAVGVLARVGEPVSVGVLVCVGVSVLVWVGVAVLRVAASYAPMSQMAEPFPSPSRGRVMPRWSRLLIGSAAQVGLSPASIAGEPDSKENVCVTPPLFVRSPSFGSTPILFPFTPFVSPQAAVSVLSMRLFSALVSVPPGVQSGPVELAFWKAGVW